MPTKKSVKQRSSNVFEKATGILLYKLKGKLDCQVAPHTRTSYEGNQYQLGHIAASIYLNKPADSFKQVTRSCGIENCVLPAHLIVDGDPLRVKDNGDLETDTNIDKPDHFGYIHNVPGELWEKMTDEEKQRAREGNFDVVKEGFAISAR